MGFQVTEGRVVVVPDDIPKEINGILLPEANAAQAHVGLIFQSDHHRYRAGMKVAFQERAGTLVKIDGANYRIVDGSEILGIVHRDGDDNVGLLKKDDVETIEAPPGYLLIEREGMQEKYSGLITLSPTYERYTLGSVACVRAVSQELAGDWEIGERVLLNANVGKKMEFGWNAERTFWAIRPEQILLRRMTSDGESQGPSPFRGMKDRDFDLVRTEQPRDEGDPRGLR